MLKNLAAQRRRKAANIDAAAEGDADAVIHRLRAQIEALQADLDEIRETGDPFRIASADRHRDMAQQVRTLTNERDHWLQRAQREKDASSSIAASIEQAREAMRAAGLHGFGAPDAAPAWIGHEVEWACQSAWRASCLKNRKIAQMLIQIARMTPPEDQPRREPGQSLYQAVAAGLADRYKLNAEERAAVCEYLQDESYIPRTGPTTEDAACPSEEVRPRPCSASPCDAPGSTAP